jgi:uncharacterized protein (DUF433 family)
MDTSQDIYVEQRAEGGWRIRGSRVSLDSIVHAYWSGRLPESIAADFPSLSLEAVHGAIAFYLRHRAEVDAQLSAQDARWEALRLESEKANAPILARLRALAGRGLDSRMSAVRLLADEDLRLEIVLATRRLEPAIEFRTVREVDLSGAKDDEILAFASLRGWVLVFHDVTTMKATFDARVLAGFETSGLFLVPQSRRTRAVADSLVLIWSASTAEDWQGRALYLPL